MIGWGTLPGTEVICICAVDQPALVLGKTYIVRAMFDGLAGPNRRPEIGVQLVGVRPAGDYTAFSRARFRRADLPPELIAILEVATTK